MSARNTDEYVTLNYGLTERGILAIELDRPDHHNALSEQLLADLETLTRTVDSDEVRCVTIEGAGDDAFSAGGEITEFNDLTPTEAMNVSEGVEAIASFPRPVLAKIDGYCLGGGFELALACDLRIATLDSTFGFPEIDLGLLPGGGGTQRLTRLIGATRAKELVFRGNRIGGERAERWGIVNRAVPAEEFDEVVETFVDDLVEGPPIGLSVAKRVINNGADASLNAGVMMESQGFGLLLSTEDVDRGIEAFQEKRDPEFEGK